MTRYYIVEEPTQVDKDNARLGEDSPHYLDTKHNHTYWLLETDSDYTFSNGYEYATKDDATWFASYTNQVTWRDRYSEAFASKTLKYCKNIKTSFIIAHYPLSVEQLISITNEVHSAYIDLNDGWIAGGYLHLLNSTPAGDYTQAMKDTLLGLCEAYVHLYPWSEH